MLLLLTTLGVYADHWNGVQDTPEVAHAKAQHFAAVAKAKAHILNAGKWDNAALNSWSVPHYAPQIKYHGPIALPPGYDKHGAPLPVLDTPEVAHVKSLHLATIAKAGGHIHPSTGPDLWSHIEQNDWSTAHYAPTIKYHGPYAYSPGFDKHGAPLPVLETPEVSHAKHQHFAAYAKAAAASHAVSHGHGHKWKRSIHEAHIEAAKHAHYAAVEKAKAEIGAAVHHQAQNHNSWAIPHYAPAVKYHGPIALPPGYDKLGAPLPVHDTPEVAHAKAAHLAAIVKAGGHIYPAMQHYSSLSSGHETSWAVPHYAAHIKYHGPIALPPGYDKHGAPLPVLDTPEVAAAKAKHFYLYAKTLQRQHSPILMYGHW